MNKHSKSIEIYAIDWQHSKTPWLYWEHVHSKGFAEGMPFVGCGSHPSWGEDIIYRRKESAPVFETPKHACEWTLREGYYDLGCTKHNTLQQAAMKLTKHCHECGGEIVANQPVSASTRILAGIEFPVPVKWEDAKPNQEYYLVNMIELYAEPIYAEPRYKNDFDNGLVQATEVGAILNIEALLKADEGSEPAKEVCNLYLHKADDLKGRNCKDKLQSIDDDYCSGCGKELVAKKPPLNCMLGGIEFPEPMFYRIDGSEPSKFKISIGAADYFFEAQKDLNVFTGAINNAISLSMKGVDASNAQKQAMLNLAKDIGVFVEEIEPLLRGDMQECAIIANKINTIVSSSNALNSLIFDNTMGGILDGRAGLLLDKLDGLYEDIWLVGKER